MLRLISPLASLNEAPAAVHPPAELGDICNAVLSTKNTARWRTRLRVRRGPVGLGISTTTFKATTFVQTLRAAFRSSFCAELLQDAFWYVAAVPGDELGSILQRRAAENLTAILWRLPLAHSDQVILAFPNVVAEIIFAACFIAFPRAAEHFDGAFAESLLAMFSVWFSGVRPCVPEPEWWGWNYEALDHLITASSFDCDEDRDLDIAQQRDKTHARRYLAQHMRSVRSAQLQRSVNLQCLATREKKRGGARRYVNGSRAPTSAAVAKSSVISQSLVVGRAFRPMRREAHTLARSELVSVALRNSNSEDTTPSTSRVRYRRTVFDPEFDEARGEPSDVTIREHIQEKRKGMRKMLAAWRAQKKKAHVDAVRARKDLKEAMQKIDHARVRRRRASQGGLSLPPVVSAP
jgi:hypothetical protein